MRRPGGAAGAAPTASDVVELAVGIVADGSGKGPAAGLRMRAGTGSWIRFRSACFCVVQSRTGVLVKSAPLSLSTDVALLRRCRRASLARFERAACGLRFRAFMAA